MGDYHVYSSSHSLRGLCGLKYPVYIIWGRMPESQPARAVWIEIIPPFGPGKGGLVTACEGCVD